MDSHDKIVLQKMVKRKDLLSFLSNIKPFVIAMEAGSGAHHWSRQLSIMGHEPRIIDPKFVIPYRTGVKSRKNDRNDARAICETADRPQMRFVPVKSLIQQSILVIHRRRPQLVAEHTRTANQIRGFFAEFVVIVAKGVNTLKREDERTRQILKINGVGEITTSAIVATVGNALVFNNGRQLASWLGLTPREYSTGGKPRLGRISKRGDVYLRTLLVHRARSELMHTAKRSDAKSLWAEYLKDNKSWNKTAVALANKHARIIWAILAKNETYHLAQDSELMKSETDAKRTWLAKWV